MLRIEEKQEEDRGEKEQKTACDGGKTAGNGAAFAPLFPKLRIGFSLPARLSEKRPFKEKIQAVSEAVEYARPARFGKACLSEKDRAPEKIGIA